MSQNLGSKNVHFVLPKLHPRWIPDKKKNTGIGLFAFDISNTGQLYSGLVLSLGMTWPNPAWGHSLAESVHYLRYPFRLCSRAMTLFPQLLVCTNPSRIGSLQPPPCLVQQCCSFHFINMACMYSQHLCYQVFFLFSFFSIISFSEFPFNKFLQNKDCSLDVGQKEMPRPDT